MKLNNYSIKKIIISLRNIENIKPNENIPLNTDNNNYTILFPTKKRKRQNVFYHIILIQKSQPISKV